MNLTKPVTRAEMIEIQKGNVQHDPSEALDVPLRDDWETREDTCGISHKKAGPHCYHVCWWRFKKNDPVEVCTFCEKWATDPG